MKPSPHRRWFAGLAAGVSLISLPVFLVGAETPPANVALSTIGSGTGAHDKDELAKSLSNPVAALISVPVQENMDFGYEGGGWKNTINIQPVIPISLNESWALIQRVILPVIYQEDIGSPGSEFGLGDTISSSFFSPKHPTANGLIWGVGPVVYIPTATNDAFRTRT